jgi:hypothetical protein
MLWPWARSPRHAQQLFSSGLLRVDSYGVQVSKKSPRVQFIVSVVPVDGNVVPGDGNSRPVTLTRDVN